MNPKTKANLFKLACREEEVYEKNYDWLFHIVSITSICVEGINVS